jgi:hypothetical protein
MVAVKKKFKLEVLSPEFRISFPKLFTPEKILNTGEPKYSMQMLFDKSIDLINLKKAVAQVAAEEYGANWKSLPKFHLPFRDGDELALEKPEGKGEYLKGNIVATATANIKFPPQIVNTKKVEILDESEVYGGCYCRAVLQVYPFDFAGKKGVTFGIQLVQKLRDAEKLAGGGGSKALSLLDDIEQPTGGATD